MQTAIAFPYRRDGEIISCKYRSVPKGFWQVCATSFISFIISFLFCNSMRKQDRILIYITCILTNVQEKDKERILYGLDDIKNASEIIIVTHLLLISLHFLSG